MTDKKKLVSEQLGDGQIITSGNVSSHDNAPQFSTRTVMGKLTSHLSDLRGSWGRILMWPVLSLSVAAGIGWSVDKTLRSEREEAEIRAMQEAVILANVYADQVRNSVSHFDHLLSTIKYLSEQSSNAYEFIQYIREGIYPVQDGVVVSVIDEKGRVIDTSKKMYTGVSAADQVFFQKAVSLKQDKMFIDVGQTPLLRSPVVRFLRRIEMQEGKFSGLIMISVPPSFLASFHDPNRFNRAEFQSVIDPEGVVISSRSAKGDLSTQQFIGKPPPFTGSKGVQRFSAKESPDARSRIVAWSSLESFPLMTTVGMNDEIVFAEVVKNERNLTAIAGAAAAILFLLGFVGADNAVRRARYSSRKKEADQAYRVANEGALEGFYTIVPVRDGSGEIIDFVTTDANERGANLAGMTAAELIGKNLSEFYSGDARQNMTDFLSDVIRTGYKEGELEASSEGPFIAQWLHYRLVRQNDCIAVTVRDISEGKRLQAQLWQTLHFDALTGLPNRNWLLKHFSAHFEKSKVVNQKLGVLYLDLDNFKAVNSTLGHPAGDQILRSVGQRIQVLLRPGDQIVRIGGDEFAVLVYDVELEDIEIVTQRLMESMNEPFRLHNGVPYRLSMSVGISRYPLDGGDIDTLLRNADVAMYASKASGKANYQVFETSLMLNVVARADCENLLRTAIEHDQFVMHYQPRVDVISGNIVSLEGLVRILHPTRGLIHPSDFIPVAEDTGLIIQIGEIVIRKACEQLDAWRREGVPLVPVSVNVSAAQFAYGRVKSCVSENLAKYCVVPQLLELELTESCMLGDQTQVAQEFALLQEMGITLLLDDFGTGYSSLSQLQTLNLNIMKIDRSFTEQLLNGENAEIFFQAMMTMAKSLNMRVVAEGVESIEQLHILKRLNCSEIQGYLVSRPVDALEMTSLLHKRILLPRLLQPVPNIR